MTIESKLTIKGQTTIPVEVREHLKIGPGDKIRFVISESAVEIVPRNRPITELFGRLGSSAIPGTTLEDYKEAVGAAISKRNTSDGTSRRKPS